MLANMHTTGVYIVKNPHRGTQWQAMAICCATGTKIFCSKFFFKFQNSLYTLAHTHVVHMKLHGDPITLSQDVPSLARYNAGHFVLPLS